MIYLRLFWAFCKVGAIGFGGGYAMLPLIQAMVSSNGWLSDAEFVDLVTISQMTPGPILINSATFVGSKTAGVLGALCATLGSVFPSCVLVLALAALYFKYKNLSVVSNMLKFLRPAVAGLIAAAGATILLHVVFPNSSFSLDGVDLFGVIVAAASFICLRLKVSPMLVIAGGGVLGVAACALGLI